MTSPDGERTSPENPTFTKDVEFFPMSNAVILDRQICVDSRVYRETDRIGFRFTSRKELSVTRESSIPERNYKFQTASVSEQSLPYGFVEVHERESIVVNNRYRMLYIKKGGAGDGRMVRIEVKERPVSTYTTMWRSDPNDYLQYLDEENK